MTKTKILEMVKQYTMDQDLRTLNELITGLESDIMDENNKANGKSNVARSIKAITGNKENIREAYQTAWIINGRTVACDGYRLISTSEPVKVSTQDTPPINFNPLIDAFYEVNHTELPTPSIGDVKTKIALDKANGVKNSLWIWDDGTFRIAVNAKYLLDMLTADPFATIRATQGNATAPIYFNDPEALVFGILLPVRTAK